jgi:hypothetical protein
VSRHLRNERNADVNPNFGYQLYQIERTKSRAETIAADQAKGRLAASFTRAGAQAAAALARLARTRQLRSPAAARSTTGVTASAS